MARFHEKPRHIPNYLSSDAESRKLVSAIEEYWHKRGHTAVRARVEESVIADNGGKSRHICVVRSNISDVVQFGARQALAA